MELEEPSKNAICILCRKIEPAWINFLKTFQYYENLFIIVDEDLCKNGASTQPDDVVETTICGGGRGRSRIKIVYVPANICRDAGFTNSSTSANLPPVIAWDKALYYFANYIANKFPHVWFIEDDVFLAREQLLSHIDIDSNIASADLICQTPEYGDTAWNHWCGDNARMLMTSRSHALVCICRISAAMLSAIDDFVGANGRLCFIEALFPTLTTQNNFLHIYSHRYFEGVFYDKKWEDDDVVAEPYRFYHPVKKIDNHVDLRCRINL